MTITSTFKKLWQENIKPKINNIMDTIKIRERNDEIKNRNIIENIKEDRADLLRRHKIDKL